MLDLRFIESNLEKVKANLAQRGGGADLVANLDRLNNLNIQRKELIQITDQLKNQRNQISKEFGLLKKKGEDVGELSKTMSSLKEKLDVDDKALSDLETQVQELLLSFPNLLSSDVPAGKDESENKEVARWGSPRVFDFTPKAHWEIGENLDIIDLKRGAKLTGSRFYVLKNYGAKLERALINFFLDQYGGKGYEEVWTPFMVNRKTMTGTGQLPKFEEELFKIEGLDYFLIPTAEVPVTNLYADEILCAQNLPQKHCCFTACFRKEAGSYGKDTRGIIRVHQFNKVELVKFTRPENSESEHALLLKDISGSLELLGLPYRVMLLCSGDTGFSAQKCYDIEVWLPSEQKYREISSISNFGEFQARRASIRYQAEDGKKAFVHTLNGSGLAVGRTMVAILENYQNPDGSVTIPEALVPYMGGVKIIGGKA